MLHLCVLLSVLCTSNFLEIEDFVGGGAVVSLCVELSNVQVYTLSNLLYTNICQKIVDNLCAVWILFTSKCH